MWHHWGEGERVADSVAITAQFNGAEYLELLARAGEASLSLPAHVLTRCGIEAWRLEAARDRAAPPPRGRPVRFALERRSVTIRVPRHVYAELDAGALAAGISIPQYIRTRCGFEVRWTSLPNTEERDHEEDDAWARLRRLGVDPQAYFPPES